MPNIKAILKKMWNTIEEQKQNINSFYQNQQTTMTDLYRAKQLTEILETNIQRLNKYLEENKKINPQNTQELARNLNNITIQTNIIKATQQALNDQNETIKKREQIQTKISGKMINNKKELNKLLQKAENILKS